MSEIRYVSISDMHFGEEDSILTNLVSGGMDVDPTKPSNCLKKLVDCLEFIINKFNKNKKPVLILNGDILELALSTMDIAAMAFGEFIKLTMKNGKELFDRIIFIPGNHDHHLWETARESQYINHIDNIKAGDRLELPRHTTNLFIDKQKKKVHSTILENLIDKYSGIKKDVHVFYPNLGIMDENGKRCVIFTHGHYTEEIYTLMTLLKELLFPKQELPKNINELEAENYAWIDFFWSTLGRSGEVGKNVESVYEKLLYVKGQMDIIKRLADGLAKQFDLPGWGDRWESWNMRFLLKHAFKYVSRRERIDTGSALSFSTEEGLRKYVKVYLREQVYRELGYMPEDVTIVFGHTHKAFEKDMRNFPGYPKWVNIYNTGGWIVETTRPEPLHGGAIVLVDEELNSVSLRMYNESEEKEDYMVSVREARHGSEKSNPFYDEISKIVNPEETPWSEFSKTVYSSIITREENLLERIERRGYI